MYREHMSWTGLQRINDTETLKFITYQYTNPGQYHDKWHSLTLRTEVKSCTECIIYVLELEA